jgi:hypothetical protein
VSQPFRCGTWELPAGLPLDAKRPSRRSAAEEPRMRCGWVAAPSSPAARCARTSPYARTAGSLRRRGPAREKLDSQACPSGRRLLCGWHCGADSRRARFVRISPTAADKGGRGCRRRPHWAQYGRALHNMREAAGSLLQYRSGTIQNSEIKPRKSFSMIATHSCWG